MQAKKQPDTNPIKHFFNIDIGYSKQKNNQGKIIKLNFISILVRASEEL